MFRSARATRAKRHDEAAELAGAAAATRRRLLGDHPVTGAALMMWGNALAKRGLAGAAEARLAEAMAAYEAAGGAAIGGGRGGTNGFGPALECREA